MAGNNDNMEEDLISNYKTVYFNFKSFNFDNNKLILLSQVLIILLLFLVILINLSGSSYKCAGPVKNEYLESELIDDRAFNLSTGSYFDMGLKNNCPILFSLSGHDDYSYGKYMIKKPFIFFNNQYSLFYINTNGFISFEHYDPSAIVKFPTSVSLIAPFWSDIDIRFSGNIFHKEINETYLLNPINKDIKKRCPKMNFKSDWAYMVSWNDAPTYLNIDDRYGDKSRFKNVFQLVITTDGANSFAIFNYVKLDWPNDYINATFQAGYNSKDSRFYVLENKNKDNLLTKTNINKPGRWVLPLNDNINC